MLLSGIKVNCSSLFSLKEPFTILNVIIRSPLVLRRLRKCCCRRRWNCNHLRVFYLALISRLIKLFTQQNREELSQKSDARTVLYVTRRRRSTDGTIQEVAKPRRRGATDRRGSKTKTFEKSGNVQIWCAARRTLQTNVTESISSAKLHPMENGA